MENCMSDKKNSDNDPERTLITLDQLSQTIEVMTGVVNRLKKHLSKQVSLSSPARRSEDRPSKVKQSSPDEHTSFMVEITQSDTELDDDRVLH